MKALYATIIVSGMAMSMPGKSELFGYPSFEISVLDKNPFRSIDVSESSSPSLDEICEYSRDGGPAKQLVEALLNTGSAYTGITTLNFPNEELAKEAFDAMYPHLNLVGGRPQIDTPTTLRFIYQTQDFICLRGKQIVFRHQEFPHWSGIRLLESEKPEPEKVPVEPLTYAKKRLAGLIQGGSARMSGLAERNLKLAEFDLSLIGDLTIQIMSVGLELGEARALRDFYKLPLERAEYYSRETRCSMPIPGLNGFVQLSLCHAGSLDGSSKDGEVLKVYLSKNGPDHIPPRPKSEESGGACL